MGRAWRLGTRGSVLARTQSEHVAEALSGLTGDTVELDVIRTRGDAIQDRPLPEVGGKGLFTKELEDALLTGAIDLAVHSMKDLPTETPVGLIIAAIPRREDPRDVLVGARLADLAAGAIVGTGSARRAAQLAVLRPDLTVRGIRGNVDTRVRKQRDGDYDAVVLAAAGLARLGRTADVAEALDVDAMVPAVGQGVLAVQCRRDDLVARQILAALTDPDTLDAVRLERAFLAALGGGCSVPAGCHATVDGGDLVARAFLADRRGARTERGRCLRADGPALGADLAARLSA